VLKFRANDGKTNGRKRGRPPKSVAQSPGTAKKLAADSRKKRRRKDDDFIVSDGDISSESDSDYDPWPKSPDRSPSPQANASQRRPRRKNTKTVQQTLPWRLREDRGEPGEPTCCVECGDLLLNPYVAYKHYATRHVHSKEHACVECGRSFVDGGSLKLHEESHAREFGELATCIECRRLIKVNPPSLITSEYDLEYGYKNSHGLSILRSFNLSYCSSLAS
jgi:hypothetical protein